MIFSEDISWCFLNVSYWLRNKCCFAHTIDGASEKQYPSHNQCHVFSENEKYIFNPFLLQRLSFYLSFRFKEMLSNRYAVCDLIPRIEQETIVIKASLFILENIVER